MTVIQLLADFTLICMHRLLLCTHSCITHVYMLKLSGDLINSKTCSASASLQIIKNQAQFTNNNNKPEGKEDDHLVEMSARSATIPKIVLLEMCN